MQEIHPRLVGACAIAIGEAEVTPAASHLFALLLALVLSPPGTWTRRALQELLFAGADDRVASHRLRQLLYRLRTFGVALRETSDGLLCVANPIGDPLAEAVRDDADPLAGEALTTALGLYAPRMPEPYLEWLEERRALLQRTLTVRRVTEVRAAHGRQDWAACVRLAGALRAVDPLNEDVATLLAEAEAMLGHRERAVEVIDELVHELDVPLDARPQLRKLRTRILSTRVPRREGTMRGREECLAFLAEQWELAKADGKGARACTILGPPGMGKSRVGESFAGTVRLAGGQVMQHRCDEHARGVPLALFSQLVPDLRRRRGALGADPAMSAVLDHVAPQAEPAGGEIGPAEVRRDAVKRAIIDLFEAVTAEQPMLLVVDDAHLLDEASRAVVRALAEGTNGAQLFVLLLCRPRPDSGSLMSASSRFASYLLPPLSDADSRALYVELSAAREPSEEEVARAVAQAEGNAFYLNALAQHPAGALSMPAHIRSLAQRSYLGLSSDARTVLDASLLLDTLASPARVTRVSAVEAGGLLGALRELEDADLLRAAHGLFVGPHALLREALEELMPTTGRAVLQRRIAEVLAAECDDPAQARLVAWAAVSAWLAAGEPAEAVRLALRVARLAAEVGEPESGAVLLGQVPREGLSVELQRELLDEVIELSAAGNRVELHVRTLAERLSLAELTGEDHDRLAALQLRMVMVRIRDHQDYSVGTLLEIVADRSIDERLRCDATAQLLVIADLHFDPALATRAHSLLIDDTTSQGRKDDSFLRADIIYQTNFGDRARALSIAGALLARHPVPQMEYRVFRSRSYAAICLHRLGFFEESARVSHVDWELANSKGYLEYGEYCGAFAVEGYVHAGQTETAKGLFREVLRAERGRSVGASYHPPVYYSSAYTIAILDADYETAHESLALALSSHSGMRAPRMRGATLANQVRLAQYQQAFGADYDTLIAELREMYEKGRCLGAQDGMAEALWHEVRRRGDVAGASRLLHNYLTGRRELGHPEFLFRQSTADDPAWQAFSWHSLSRDALSPRGQSPASLAGLAAV